LKSLLVLFNSFEFAVFLVVVFFVYWFLTKKVKSQNIMLMLASYVFYSWWDYRFVFLLFFSTLLDYFSGLQIEKSKPVYKKVWLIASVSINLGFLMFFKYYNFFTESFGAMLGNMGFRVNYASLNIILPVGISFYTFHGLSYVFDIYNGKIKATRNFIDYSLFVSFFPLLVAGPIERATHLLPQVKKARQFNYTYAVDGMKQILWGLFKKVVIADNCAEYANLIFNGYGHYSGSTLLLGAIFFAFQIYGDFSGYSDIALGTARLFGFELLRNFAFPYFSRDIAEFWRRWHISLSSWFRDYLYLPLGGSKVGTWKKVRNTFIIFLVSGFWHGANWTFLFWGFFNALLFVPLLLLNQNRNNVDIVARGRMLPSLKDAFKIGLTFFLVVIAWIFFRSQTVTGAFEYLSIIFSASLLHFPEVLPKLTIVLIAAFMIIEWIGRENNYAIQSFGKSWPRPIRWSFYYLLLIVVFVFSGIEQPFIYFQF
jgi:D-alanyl-lipoteichoic acid acyltransferase DltB (MBOAT superfamily)